MDIASRPSEPANPQVADAAAPPHVTTIRREDYRPPDWLVPEIALDFALSLDETSVTARLSVRRNPDGAGDAAIRLNGDGLAATAEGRDTIACVTCDLADPEAIVAMSAEVLVERGPVRVLVNNAGVDRRLSLDETDDEMSLSWAN